MCMAGQLSQSERVAEFKTPLGENVLALIKLDGSEVLGDMFQFDIEALSEKENIDFDKALGQGCMLKLDAYEKKKRIYHGVMTEAQWIGKIEDFFHYRITLRPWFWLLGHKADCRIFLDKDVKDIIKDVFDKRDSTTTNSGPMATTRKFPIACSIAKPIWHSSAGSWSCTASIISSSIPTKNI